MPRTAAKADDVHLTEAELGVRWGVKASTVAALRKSGKGPAPLVITESRTKKTIRYRLSEVTAWEDVNLKVPAPA